MHRGFPPFIEDQIWCVIEPLIKKYLNTHLKNSKDHIYLGTHTKMAVCIPSWCRGRGSEILPQFKHSWRCTRTEDQWKAFWWSGASAYTLMAADLGGMAPWRLDV